MTLDPFNHTAVRRGFIKEEHLEVRERGTLNTIIVIVMHVFKEEVVARCVLREKELCLRHATAFHDFWQDQLKLKLKIKKKKPRPEGVNIKNKSKWWRHLIAVSFQNGYGRRQKVRSSGG
ncbi:expressed unknown protein [Seminavis robusta]|uniref:Uncharacterized protein n=1 Tax=Seminavis robusta TaxID=568900 RepID=A0A9N8DBV7_9STRA|nr:expressed unknown protein [Seminavis robusta]|eukprot:Sro27_g018230.1 n/a (120) ;mRNA; f:99326-99685